MEFDWDEGSESLSGGEDSDGSSEEDRPLADRSESTGN